MAGVDLVVISAGVGLWRKRSTPMSRSGGGWLRG